MTSDSRVVIKRHQAHEKYNTEGCLVVEYLFPSKKLGFAFAQIDGRYPGTGRMINKEVDLIYYVISGQAVIHQEDGEHKLMPGDCFFLRKGTWYWIDAQNLYIAVPSSPAWYNEQYEHLE